MAVMADYVDASIMLSFQRRGLLERVAMDHSGG